MIPLGDQVTALDRMRCLVWGGQVAEAGGRIIRPTSHFRSARSPTPIAPRLSSAQMSQSITSINFRGIMSGGANDSEYIEGELAGGLRGVDDGIFPTKDG